MKDFEIRKNGKLISQDELREQATAELVEVLAEMYSSEALELANAYREEIGENLVYEYDEDNVNEVLIDWDAWDLLDLGKSLSYPEDYFYLTNWNDFEFTDDVWEGLEIDDVIMWILDDAPDAKDYLPLDGKQIVEAYEAATNTLEELGKYPAMVEAVLKNYKDCKADQYDLVYLLEKILRNCDIIGREN